MPTPDKIDQLYDALKADGAVSKSRENFRSYMLASGDQGYRNRKQLYDALKADGAVESATYEEFRDRLGLHAVKPQQPVAKPSSTPRSAQQPSKPQKAKQQPKKTAWKPTPAQQLQFQQTINSVQQTIQNVNERHKNMAEYSKQRMKHPFGQRGGLAFGVKNKGALTPFDSKNLVQGRDEYNPKTGKFEPTYITAAGNKYSSRLIANSEQRQIDDAMERELHPIETQLRDAYAERDRLNKLAQERVDELEKSHEELPWYLKLGEYANSDKMPDAGSAMHRWDNDMQYKQYMAALRKNRALITTLEDKKSGKMNEFWHTLGNEITNGYTFSLAGKAQLDDMAALTFAQKHVDAINKKRQKGEALTKEEQAAEAVLKNAEWDNRVQSQYGDEYGAWARAGKMGAVSLDLMVDFALMGGQPLSLAKSITGGTGKLATKLVGNAATKGFGKYMVKATGATLGSMVAGAEIANTIGIGRTMSDAVGRYQGDVILDENGDYVFGHFEDDGKGGQKLVKGGDSFIGAVLGAERTAIAENGSEIAGAFLPGGNILLKGMEKIGLSKIASGLTSLSGKQWYAAYSRALQTAGFNGVPGEALEEYVGTGFDALMGGEEWKNLADKRTHVDIWLGCATMGALLNAPRIVGTGNQMAQYYRYKHNTDKSDRLAETRLGNEVWEPLRQQIDEATNGQITDVLVNVLDNENLNEEQRKAVAEYAVNLQRMRGYSLGRVSSEERDDEHQPTPRELDEQALEQSYTQGYGATDIADMQDIKHGMDYQHERVASFADANLMSLLDGSPMDAIDAIRSNEQLSDEQKQIAIDYVKARNTHNALLQRINDDADALADEQREQTKQMQHTDGSLRPAILKEKDDEGHDRQVFIVDGNVQMMADGSMVDPEASDKSVVIFDPATGERKMIDPTADTGILSVDEVTTAEQHEANIERSRQEYVQAQIDEAQGTVRFAPGQQLVLPTGEEAVVVATDADGENITVALGDGTQATVQRSELQRIRDEKASADYRQRHGITEEPAAQQPEASTPAQPQADGRVAGAPADYTADMELTIRDEDGEEKPAMVMGMFRMEATGPVADADGKLVGFLMDGEPHFEHVTKLGDKVVSHTEERTVPKEMPQYSLYDDVYLQTEDGEIHGNVIAEENPDGLITIQSEQPIGGRIVNQFTREQLDGMTGNNVVENIPVQGNNEGEKIPQTPIETPTPVEQTAEVAQQPVQEPVQTVEPQPAQPAEAPAQPTEQPTAEPMPVGEDGEEDWQATTPERAHAYIFNEAGLSRSEGNEFIAAQTQAAQSALVKAKSAQMPRVGTSIKKYNEAKAKRQEKIDEAQRVLDYWNGVREIQNAIQREENERRAAEDAVRHDEAVAEAQAEYEARKQAEAERKAVGNENPMPAITEKWNNATKVDGHRDEIMLPDGTPLKGHYVLHESGASSPSHNPETWQKTDGFPMDANDNSVNDRDYERDHDAQEHTQSIARQYDQRALQSVPVVSNDGVVLSGNGRTMAGQLAARDNTDGAYVDYLKEYAPKFGFTAEQVEAMRHPRVSFVPYEAMPYTAETFAKFNQQEMKSQNKTEQAVKLGKTVSDDSFKGIVRTINGYDTLGDFYNDAQASLGAVYDLHNAGVVPQAQLAEMVDGVRGQEKLSAVGREFLENMLIGKAFESDPEVVRMLTAESAMRQTVITALGEIVDNIALGGDWSLQGELADAVKLCFDARQGGAKYGEIVSTYARQGVLFADPDELQTVADFNNATMLMLADVLNDKRVTLLKTTLQLYNNNARQSAMGQTDLFAGGIQSREDILRDVITFINENYGKRKEIEAARAAAVERRKAESVQQDGTPPAVNNGSEDTGRSERSEEEIARLTHDEAITLIAQMEERADVAPDVELTIENWDAQFGEDGRVNTPIGDVKMGENQFTKLMRQGREGKLGMIKPTLETPDVIIEDASEAKEDDVAERNSSYVFVKAFKKADGSRYYYFTSVTVSKDGKEVVISNQEKRKNAIANLLTNGKLVWKHADDVSAASDVEQGLYSSQGNMSDPTTEGTDAPQTNVLSASKGSKNSATVQEKTVKVAENQASNAVQAALAAAEQETNNEPTEAQKEAGNYKKGHVKIDGYDVTIENPKGSVRRGTDASGKQWEQEMQNTYGYIRGTEGVDGDHIDVFFSEDPSQGDVFVVDQVNKDGSFDEHKVMYGFPDIESARKAYLSNYEDGWQGLGAITPVSKEEFKKWIDSSHRKTKPFAEYSSVKPLGDTQLGEQLNKPTVKAGEDYVSAAERIAREDEVKRTAAHFAEETQEEATAFDKRVPEMDDVELLAYMQEDGRGDLNKAYHPSVYDEYDYRHGDEQLQSYDDTLVRLNESGTTLEQAEEMLANIQKDVSRLATEDRAMLLGQEDALQEYIAGLEKEGGRDVAIPSQQTEQNESDTTSSTINGNGRLPEPRRKNAQGSGKKSSSDGKIDDVGEVLAGARKDMRKEIAKSLANVTEAALVEKPFGKVYKNPDLKKAVESGALREKDAIFYEALFSMVNQQKPKVTQSEMRSKRYIPDHKTKAERWAADTFKQMEVLRQFMELDEPGRDAMMERMLADRYPTREQELAEIEKRKGWNPDYEGHKYEWGEMTTPNPLWVTHEVMNRLGYSVGDKLDVPYGVVKANTSGTGYSIENLKGERASLFGSGMTLDEAIDRIVYLAKLKRGDADVSHPTQLFAFPATKSESGESGRYRVMWGRDYKTREFDSKDEADAFAQTKNGAYVSPIMETKRRFGYKVRFIHPLTGEKMFVDDTEFDTKEEAQAYFDGNFEKLNEATNAKLQEEREKKGEKKTLTADDVVHVTMVHSGKGGWTHAVVIDKKYANNDGQVRIIKEGFASRKNAKSFADSVKDDVLKTVLQHKEDAKKIVYFDTGENSRIGEDYRNGKNVDAEDFMNTFGFRGVQFGNWTNQADRQMAVNQAYDAFMDMARLIGVSPKAMSLNGELGIAFGARGVGGFAAHYEPGEVVINLTKTQGAGSLAHEWWHALDNYFARRAGSAGDMVTDNRRIEMRDALRKAFNDMLDLVNGSDYAQRSAAKGEYWGRTHEITARLLAEWVDRELKKRGELNTFLSRGAVVERGQQHNYDVYEVLERLAGREPMPFEEYKELPESLKGIPYPSAKEVEQFGGSLRHIFDTLEEKVDEETGNVMLYEPTATYETRDGGKVVCRSLFDEMDVRDEGETTETSPQNGEAPDSTSFNPSELRLRKLKKGETCHVERVYEETKQFDFTGKEKVESAEDVAYIFRQLENAAVENSFLVLVKDGRPTVIHLGMGGYVSVMAPYEQALVAYRELKPEQVYFVHNHPSGVLKASRQDQELLKRVKMAFGEDVVQQGIIIDTTSGKYGEFDMVADNYDLVQTSGVEAMPQSEGADVPVKVYQFSRQVFAPDWNPESAFKIVSSQSVAEFVSSHRLGEHKKMSFLVVNNSGNVVANVFLPWTKLSDIKRSKAGDLLAGYVHQCGGVRGVLYGNYDYEADDRAVLAAVGGRMRQLNAPLMDALHVEHSAYESGWAGVGEPGVGYGVDARDVAQGIDDNNGTEVVRFIDFLRRGRLEQGESRYFHVGETGDILNEHGISGKITIGTSAVNSHHNEDADHLDENDWVEVIEKINEPVAITEYGDKGNSYRIYTIVEKNGKNICVGVDVNSVGRDVNITNIRTAFARDIANALNERLVYPHSRTELETAIRELSLRHNREVYPEQPYDAANIRKNSETQAQNEENLLLGRDGLDKLPQQSRRVYTTKERREREAYAEREPQQRQAGAITDEQVEALNANVKRTMQEDRDMMRSAAEQMGEKLHTNINIIEDVNEITHPNAAVQERRRRSEGWYDRVTRQVHVVLPNNRDIDDVKATVAHETIAHKGLRELVGEENYDEFLDETYQHLRDDLKKGVDAAAGRAFIDDTTKNGKRAKSYEQHRRTAVDELFGRMAEKPFEEFSEGERTLWQKIKATVRRLLDKFLGSLKLPKWFEIGDNELRYILWRSKERLERGKEHPIDLARDIVKRDELGLTDEARYNMGDVAEPSFAARRDRAVKEHGYVHPGLNSAEVKVVSIKEKSPFDTSKKTKALKEDVVAYANEHGIIGTMTEEETKGKGKVTISKASIEKMVDDSATGKSVDKDTHLAIIPQLREVIAESVMAETHPDYNKGKAGKRSAENGYNPDNLIHRCYGAISIDGQEYRVKLTLKENPSQTSRKAYTYEVTKIELLDSTDGERTGLSSSYQSNSNGSHTSKVNALVPVAVAKVIKNVEKSYDTGKKLLDESKIADESTDLYREVDETDDIWNDQSLGLQECITAAATRLANKHRDNKTLRNDAMRAIGGNLADLAKSMLGHPRKKDLTDAERMSVDAKVGKVARAQKRFDQTTVKRVADLARVLITNGYINNATSYEIKRLLSAVKNSVGHNDIEGYVQKVMDIMVDNQLKHAEDTLHELEAIRGSKVDARGVEVQGQLDPAGAHTMKVLKKTRGWEKTDIEEAISEAQQRMGSSDVAVADEAALEYTGLQLALEYAENIKDSKVEEHKLREEIKQAHDDASERDRATDSYRQYIASLQEAIRQNKIERAQSYFDLVGRLSDSLRESIANAKDFKEAEKQRIREIQHNANSDMEGRASNEHQMPANTRKKMNNLMGNSLFAPLATYMEMLRLFGRRSANGEGYLFNRFGRGWIDARQKEIRGVRDKYAMLDRKAAELFGGKVKTWGDLIRRVGKLPKGTVSFWNGGEMQERELTQGNLMYIYMVNKMLDGRMKLRKMGITEENVADIEEVLDPRLLELADWLQDEFLVQTRNEYNETHKRMFGASMAAIEHYFPLRVLKNAIDVKAEDLDKPEVTDGISTITGSIIKRRRNSKPLDILNADALHVILSHVAEMEHWNAYAEFNRDLNTLRSYRRFRNQVQNMNTIYGNGKELWDKFNDVCQMATGAYKPKGDGIEKAILSAAQGVTAAKVSFRQFTALKQFASLPAYFPYVRADYLVKSMARPDVSWSWCMEHLPIFEERWKSRVSGDPRLAKSILTAADWQQNLAAKVARAGMVPNAFVDALTVSMGAYAVYQTRKGQYLRDGYSEEQAERRAIQDAEIVYNETQQSGESAFTSTMQTDRTWWKVMFSIFRNSSMAYQRQLHGALRDIGNMMKKGGVSERLAFMKKQMMRDGLSEAQADSASKRRLRRQFVKDGLAVATFGYIMQLAWNITGYLPYLLFGDDDETKDEFWDDIWTHTMGGWLEGLTGGDVMSLGIGMWLSGEVDEWKLKKEMPLTTDLYKTGSELFKGDYGAFVTDAVNLCVQIGLGVNPQSITDGVLAIMDACGDDPALAHEATICISRILQVPQSQIDKMYFDEVGLSGDEVSKYTPAQLAERYAEFKVKRGRFFSPLSWDDEERIGKFTDKANKTIKERTEQMGDDKVNEAYLQYEEVYKGVDAKVKEARKSVKDGDIDIVQFAEIMRDLQSDQESWRDYIQFKTLDKNLGGIVKKYLGSQSAEEAALCRQAVLDYKSAMVKVLEAPDDATRSEAMGRTGAVMQEFTDKYVQMQQPNR